MAMNSWGRFMSPNPGIGPSDSPESVDHMTVLARALWLGKWIIAAMGFAGLGAALFSALFLIKPVYQAQTTLLYEPSPDALTASDTSPLGLSADITAINTQLQVLQSDRMMRELATELNLKSDPEFNAPRRVLVSLLPTVKNTAAPLNTAVKNLAGSVSVDNIRNSRVLRLRVQSTDAAKAVTLANALATLYLRQQIEDKQSEIATSAQWLSERVATLEQDIASRNTAAQTLNASVVMAQAEALAMRISETKDRLALLNRPKDMSNRESVDIDRASRQTTALEAALSRLEADYDVQTKILADLQQTEREARTTELLHQSFLTRLKETTLKTGLQVADSRVISPAISGDRIAPRPVVLGALGAATGIVLGIGIVFLHQSKLAAFPTAQQLEDATELRVLGHMPKAPIRARRQLVPYLAQNPTSPVAEAARNLRTSLLLGNAARPPKVILCTSSIPDEGKTTTAIALAGNLASLGRSVLLIKADIRRLTFRAYFEENPRGGLLRAMSQTATLPNLIVRDTRLGIDVLHGEKSQNSAADLFAGPAFKTVLDALMADYDHILIDSPPVLAVPDARVIGQSADAILLTVAPALTNRDQMQQAVREFASVNLSVTGLVMSDVGAIPHLVKQRAYGAYPQYYTA